MPPEESVYEEVSDMESTPTLEKLVPQKFEWRSEELDRELMSLDCKGQRASSGRLISYPKGAPGPLLKHCNLDSFHNMIWPPQLVDTICFLMSNLKTSAWHFQVENQKPAHA